MSSISFEQQVALTYLAATLHEPTAQHVGVTDELLVSRAEYRGRICAMQAEAFMRGYKEQEAAVWKEGR